MGERALKWVENYLEYSRPQLLRSIGEQQFFISGYGEGFNGDSISRMVANYIKKAEIGKSGSCHLIRHTMATLMLENGADIRFIQQMHANTHPGCIGNTL